MRRTLITGLALLVLGPLAVVIGSVLDLELDTTVLLGVAVGAALALVPDRRPGVRLAAFLAGIGAAWLTYLARAGFTPDTTAGRALVVALLVVLCVGISLASVGQLALWAVLLGAGTLAGAYEAAYQAAPPEVVTTSLTAVTALLVSIGFGFLAGSFAGAAPPPAAHRSSGAPGSETGDGSAAGTDEQAGLGVLGGAR